MVRQRLCIAIFALAALAFCAREASAQLGIGGYGMSYGDTVSPYLNLLTAGNGGGLGTYQNLVEPIIDGRNANRSNQAGINQLQNQINGGVGGRGNSGAGRHFMNYSHFYIGIRH